MQLLRRRYAMTAIPVQTANDGSTRMTMLPSIAFMKRAIVSTPVTPAHHHCHAMVVYQGSRRSTSEPVTTRAG